MTGRVIRAEWQKLWVGRTWWVQHFITRRTSKL